MVDQQLTSENRIIWRFLSLCIRSLWMQHTGTLAQARWLDTDRASSYFTYFTTTPRTRDISSTQRVTPLLCGTFSLPARSLSVLEPIQRIAFLVSFTNAKHRGSIQQRGQKSSDKVDRFTKQEKTSVRMSTVL